MADDDLAYEDVVDVWEREKDYEQPCDLPDDFYRRLREYIQDLEKKTEEIGITPSNKSEKRVQKQYERVKKISELFFKERQKKIVLAAYHKSLGQAVSTKNLTDKELQLLDEVSSLLKDLKNIVFLGEYKRKPKDDRDEEEVSREEKREKEEKKAEEREESKAEKEEDQATGTEEIEREKVEPHEELLIHILEDVPPFVDLDTSYELNKEDVVTLQEDIAEVLIERGKARKIRL